ncbi:MAG: DUF6351 family protein [Acidimicrobiia bacterium]
MRRPLVLLVIASLTAGALALGTTAGAATRKLRVVAVSTKPEYVTGGDVLVRVLNATGTPKFSVAGHEVTAKPLGKSAWLVSGLPGGASRITATAGGQTATLAVVDHSISGPVFSGPHLPLLCTTPAVAREATTDAKCDAPTTVEYLYKTVSGGFAPLPAGTDHLPTGGAAANVNGQSVPYVVRLERGMINRTPYSFAVLNDPSAWNKRLVYQFGGGCGTTYSQGSPLGTDVMNDSLLQKGYAVATANFNTFQTSCNDVLSAETAMMVKEHVAETIGMPRFTIGAGASGGAIQQLMIAQNYPGILDAISPVIPFPDAISTAPGVSDCGLLAHFYSGAGKGFTTEQRAAVNGHRTIGTCALWISSFLSTIDPNVGCDPRIPKDEIFSKTNDHGIRCTLQDLNRNEFGIDPRTGYANRPLDNVGVQYGLKALNAGTITVDQFLDLNADIGGYDINGQFTADREQATPAQMRRAYATGRVLSGGGNMREIPIITVNLYSDPYGDIHDRFRLFTIRERLRDKDGKIDANEVIWTRPSGGDIAAALTGTAFDPTDAITLLDHWLTIGYRPKEAVDNCTDATGKLISGSKIYNQPGPCRDLYPVFGDPRTAAGAPLINDRLKCQRTDIDPNQYKVKLTSAQLSRLREIFPSGVCNWRKPGVGQVPLAATWINYGKPPFGIATK